ncbi:MAG: cation-translocating P-type ATPase [Chitinophagales bacterium]|nr:cation-translocating P-type ATPase [Chitinophagales bacterium]
MPEVKNPFPFTGLTDVEVNASRQQWGSNKAEDRQNNTILIALKDTFTEPMFLILVATTIIYFVMGQIAEGSFMLGAIILVSGISFFQDSRSRKALAELKDVTKAKAKLIRNNVVAELPSEEIVVGDYLVVAEGTLLLADGEVVQANDFSVNESILTGESFSVAKHAEDAENNKVAQGTLAVSGLAVVKVTAIGGATQFGKIGKKLEDIADEKTPLQIQIGKFVRNMAIAGGIVFLLIWGINYYQSRKILESLLKGLTLAMSVLPEEIPVTFTSFMALGAWRLMKRGIIVKQTKTVEALGSASVICTDKTGTITENKMELAAIYVHQTKATLKPEQFTGAPAEQLLTIAMWASEPVPFDPMEIALHKAYQAFAKPDIRPQYKLIHEYPLSGKPPMMTHFFEDDKGHRIVACKGAAESLMQHSGLSEAEKAEGLKVAAQLSAQGYRVLGVGETTFEGNDFKKEQQEYAFNFLGFVAFFDPPKANIGEVLKQFYQAGIAVKIITGDNAVTTAAIAKQAGFKGAEKTLNGEDLQNMSDEELKAVVINTNIFTRMFPEAKLRIIKALKEQGQIVAMTGDGVNDALALKAAHIGIAMGKRGSETAKQAASLILTDDDLGKMIEAIAMGRKIYNNLKKAIQYIISIHVPIILTVALPLILGWAYPNIFTPVHVIFLELIMGPTCSLVYENEPLEKNSMLQPPRPLTSTFLQWRELLISVIQGLVITAGTMGIYQYAVLNGHTENFTRTMLFTTLVVANIFLTLVNRSFYYSVFTSLTYKNNLLIIVLSVTVVLLGCLLYIPFMRNFFKFELLGAAPIGIATATAFVSVMWFEVYKLIKRLTNKPVAGT